MGAHLGEKVVREKEYRSAMTASQIQANSNSIQISRFSGVKDQVWER